MFKRDICSTFNPLSISSPLAVLGESNTSTKLVRRTRLNKCLMFAENVYTASGKRQLALTLDEHQFVTSCR